MVSLVLGSVLLFADGSDEKFLQQRVKEIAAAYEERASRQTSSAARERLALVRELGHLPYSDAVRGSASKVIVGVLASEASYRNRIAAAHAAAAIGTRRALRATYRMLFGPDGRSGRYALLYTALPEALGSLKYPEGVEWVGRILDAAARSKKSAVLAEAGPLRNELLALTLQGVGRARLRLLGPEVLALAKYSHPRVRIAALHALAALDAGDKALLAAAMDANARARAAAAGFPRLPPDRVRKLLVDPSLQVRRAMIDALGRRAPPVATPLLVDALRHEGDPVNQLRAAEALNRMTGKDFGWDWSLWRTWWNANALKFDGPAGRDRKSERYFFKMAMRTRRVLFVLDLSNSMSRKGRRGRTRHQIAGDELRRTLQSLPAKARFSLLAFSSSVRRWPEDQPAARVVQAHDAYSWFMRRRPAGATNTLAALMNALHDPLKPDTIVLLSDGNPFKCTYKGENLSQHQQILWRVREVNADKGIRIHAVALLVGARRADKEEDSRAAAEFMRRLAGDHGGKFREVR